MVATATVALMFLWHSAPMQAVSGASVWEELPNVQKLPGYHPMLRFGCWQIIRFNLGTTYMFVTPDFVQQGQYEAGDGQYSFRAVMANELENADVRKLLGGMDAPSGHELEKSYAKSMSNFEGSYSDATNIFTVTYPVDGKLKTYQLHATTEGDDQLPVTVSGSMRGMIGLWHTPEPFPDKLDARTRYKIGDLDGLQRFAGEAKESNGAEFGILDLRSDGTFRIHATLGSWKREGSTLTLFAAGKRIELTVSANGAKLSLNGKAAYQRN